RWWRDAAPGRTPRDSAGLSARAIASGHEHRRHPRPRWTVDRPDARRMAGGDRLLALDLSHQHSDRTVGLRGDGLLHAGGPGAGGAAVRSRWLRAARYRTGSDILRARWFVRVQLSPRHGADSVDLRPGEPGGVLAARGAAARSPVSAQ